MPIVRLVPSGTVFELADGETVLSAALRQGVQLPHGCKNGICNTCAMRILSGTVSVGAKTISGSSVSPPEILVCCARTKSDIVIGFVDEAPAFQPSRFSVRMERIEHPCDGVVVVHALPDRAIEFRPGQYIEFLVHDGERRAFSIANCPDPTGMIQLHIRRVPGGAFTEYVFGQMREGAVLNCEGPLGRFRIHNDKQRPKVLVASGTGFAPLKAMIEEQLQLSMGQAMVLYWGGRRPTDLYLSEVAEDWARQHPRFNYVPVISESVGDDNWSGRTGLVHHAVEADFPDLSHHEVYACGVPAMVEAARASFIGKCHLPVEAFFEDSFAYYGSPARPPSDHNDPLPVGSP